MSLNVVLVIGMIIGAMSGITLGNIIFYLWLA